MIGRRLPAVVSPISAPAVVRALAESVTGAGQSTAAAALVGVYGKARVLLTDSGTSALVTALRSLVRPGGNVAFPAFGCVDLAAAAQRARVRVRLYDLDPATLSADLDSVRSVLHRGVDAIVVAHLFGYPSDGEAVRSLASAAGVRMIEDAAQGAGGTLRGQRLGTFGDLTVLSFGRGKGMCAGGGGALLTRDDRIADIGLPSDAGQPLGWGGMAKTLAQLVLGRPSLYAIPAMIPSLRLGEMVYHPAGEPARMSRASTSLLRSAIGLEFDDLARRRRTGAMLDALVSQASGIGMLTPIPGSNPGYLRYGVRDASRTRLPDGVFGVLRSYPKTLSEQAELIPLLVGAEPPMPGAVELRERLFSLPTHRFVSDVDLAGIARWLRIPGGERL